MVDMKKFRENWANFARTAIGSRTHRINTWPARARAFELNDRYILEILDRYDAGKELTGWQAAALAKFIGYHILKY